MRHSRLATLAVLAAALWPVWRWYASRARDPGEGWELLSLATAAIFVSLRAPPAPARTVDLRLPALLLLAYAATYSFVPPLLRAGIAFSALAAASSTLAFGRRLHVPLAGLILLALPVIASLNFYVGYPLRVTVGALTAALLQMNGFAVVQDAALLVWGGQSISIDAPCSGVNMLWAGLYLAFALAAFHELSAVRTALLALLATCAVLAANVLRAAALFYVEAAVVRLPGDWHAAIGLTVFVLAALVLAGTARSMNVPKHAA
ncbi:MAG TPA: archaeosortase/exosortase family protein [Burkholderiales bacterium]|nr:archaeosortase/exosortase family protein [Burkholderiales bacterium]